MRILYIEDTPADAQLVKRYIALTPHQLTLTQNLDGARSAMNEAPDLVLVDVLIDKMRAGYDFVRELRHQGYEKPIIAVTALTTPSELEQCRQAGVDDILTKPYTIDQLVDMLGRYTS